MGDMNRAFSLYDYQKSVSGPEQPMDLRWLFQILLKTLDLIVKNMLKPNAIESAREKTARQTFVNLKEANAPQRKYIRKGLDKIVDRIVKIQSILLEYDQKNILLSSQSSAGDSTAAAATSAGRLQLKLDQQGKQTQQQLLG